MLSTVLIHQKTELCLAYGRDLLLLLASQHFLTSKQASKHLTLPS